MPVHRKRTMRGLRRLIALPVTTVLVGLAALGSATAAPSAPSEAYDPTIGNHRQLFIDDYRVASADHVERVLHEGERSEAPVLVADKPWEDELAVNGGTIIWNPDLKKYQAWYFSYSWQAGRWLALYAESPNGTTWFKPDLGLVSIDGSTANNVLAINRVGSVLYDPRDPDPQRRYKLLAFMPSPRGYHTFVSPDGIAWTKVGSPALPNGDVQSLTYDPYQNRYVAITKQPMPKTSLGYENRVQFISFSTDFQTWTAPAQTLAADTRDVAQATANGAQDRQIYGLTVTPYEGAYVGMPWLYEITGTGPTGQRGGAGTIDVQLAVSRDLQGPWSRPDRTPILPLGPAGHRDAGMTLTASTFNVVNNRIEQFYSGWDGDHGTTDRSSTISRAIWRLDGFASMRNGGDRPGILVTRPVGVAGDQVHVNAALKGRGSLRAELLGADGKAIPGFTAADSIAVRGDQLDAVLRWRGQQNLAALRGQQVSIRFLLDGGDLYSFSIR